LSGKPATTDREIFVRGMREHLGVDLACPEADIVAAMGTLSPAQRRLLADLIAKMLPQIETITVLADAKPTAEPAAAEPATAIKKRRLK
jgi:hypothetical protein